MFRSNTLVWATHPAIPNGCTRPAPQATPRPSSPFSLSRESPFRILAQPMAETRITDELNQPDAALEVSLRPSLFSDFTGQAKVKERVEIALTAAATRRRS